MKSLRETAAKAAKISAAKKLAFDDNRKQLGIHLLSNKAMKKEFKKKIWLLFNVFLKKAGSHKKVKLEANVVKHGIAKTILKLMEEA